MADFAHKFRWFGIIVLPALLLWIEGWGYMTPDYSGPHTFEWGYLAAFVFSILLWLSMFMPSHRRANFSAWALVFAAAFGLAINAWFFEDRFENVAYWHLSLVFVVFTILNMAAIEDEDLHTQKLHKASLITAFFGLLLYIGVSLTWHIGEYQEIFAKNHQISGYLTSGQREVSLRLCNWMFYAGLISLVLSVFMSARIWVLSYIRKWSENSFHMGFLFAIKVALILIFPLYHWLGALAPAGSDTVFGYNIIYLKIVAFVILILASIPVFAADILKNDKSELASVHGAASTILLTVSFYSFTPFVSDTLGDVKQSAFWVLIYPMLLLLLRDIGTGGYKHTTNPKLLSICRALFFSALAAPSIGIFQREFGMGFSYRGSLDAAIALLLFAWVIALPAMARRKAPLAAP